MLAKRILNLSINYRKLIFTHKLNPIVSSCQVKGFSDHVKPLSNVDDESHNSQYNLSEVKSSSIVLDLLKINFNEHNLSSSDTIRALTKLVQLCKQETVPPEQVVHEDFFKNLCVLINSQANNLNLSEAIEILALLRSLKVRSSSETIQHLLERVNRLLSTASFANYNKIMQIITKLPPSFPSAREIKVRLIKKFILKMSTEFDGNEPDFLIEAFRFACLYVDDQKILKMLIDALQNNDFDKLSSQSILSLMETLNSMNYYTKECDVVLLKAQNAFIKNIPQIDNKDILFTLRQSCRHIRKNREQFYNKTVFDKAVEKLISTECDLTEGVDCLQLLIDIKHTSKDLLNYLSSEVYAQREVDGKEIDDSILSRMLEGFADLKYKPFCWDTFLQAFKVNQMLKFKMETLLYRAYHLACLDHYKPRVLEKIFSTNFNFQENRHFHHTLLKLYQKIRTTPDYRGPLPSEKQVESFENLMREIIDYPLYTSLTEALGGSQYVKSNIRTKLYHHIDHVVAFHPGGEPLAIDNIQNEGNVSKSSGSVEYLEDLNIPENCQVIAIAFTPWFWYARNTNEMLGKFSTYFETMETSTCRVITVNDNVWHSIPKASRSEYLMDLIKKKLEEDQHCTSDNIERKDIAIILVTPFWCVRDTGEILGTHSTYIETLEALSCQVVTVKDKYKVWPPLPENLNTAFLSNLIRKKKCTA